MLPQNGVEHTYVLEGAKILRETWGINELVPLYDNEDSICGILYNQVPYYFRKNLQGDIIAITDEYGETVARYTYDAWGKCTIVDLARAHEIATINPFRYRSYYYDSETQLYYLQSRYYNPKLGRFINGDDIFYLGESESTLDIHLFAYCENEPIGRIDTSGDFWLVALTVGVTVVASKPVAVASLVSKTMTKANKNYDYNKQKKREVTGTVYGQSYVDMKFASTTIAQNGCGIVAAHNALIALKKGKKLSEIVYYFDKRNAVLGDLWKAPFWDVAGCVRKYAGVSSKTQLFPKKVDSAIKNSKNKMGVIAFKWHYFFTKWDSKKKKFLVYNHFTSDTSRYEYTSIDTVLVKKDKLCVITF